MRLTPATHARNILVNRMGMALTAASLAFAPIVSITCLVILSPFVRVKGYKEIPQLLSALANHRMKKGVASAAKTA